MDNLPAILTGIAAIIAAIASAIAAWQNKQAAPKIEEIRNTVTNGKTGG